MESAEGIAGKVVDAKKVCWRVDICWAMVALLLPLEIALAADNAPDNIYLEHDTYVELEDNISLFEIYPQQASRYIYTSVPIKQRGCEWWQISKIMQSSPLAAEQMLCMPTKELKIRMFATNSDYRVGGEVEWSQPFGKSWGVSAKVLGLTGRDARVEGVFRQELAPEVTIYGSFDSQRYLTLTAKVPYQMRGLRSDATQECYTLTHNNLYNPSWGYYHGEVRNARVVRNFVPTLQGRFQSSIAESTIASAEVEAQYGTRKVSRLGWYDAANPTPNYYYKMPSYFEGEQGYESVMESWQQNDTQYTQIGWDALEQQNMLSADGSAHYVVEDMVERVADVVGRVMFDTELDGGVKVSYGASVEIQNRRNYKQMRDLLGAEYLLDIDQYATDETHTGNNLQNDLRNPNREILQGDRFGYDYTLHRTQSQAQAAVSYNSAWGGVQVSAAIGGVNTHRTGHYEKERFAGSASYGDSQSVKLATYSLSGEGRYVVAPRHTLEVSVDVVSDAPLARYMFVDVQNSNRIVESPTTEKSYSADLTYRYSSDKVTLSAVGYLFFGVDGAQVWQGYDDLSSTYCDVVISDIATRSLGIEMSGEIKVARRWRILSTLAVGGYIYTSSPMVRLYDNSDLSLVAESRASTLKGYIVGNTPQIVATVGAKYLGKKGWFADADLGYTARRYIAPSIIRRTDRIVNSMSSVEQLNELLNQEQLPNSVELNISITKSFALRNGAKIVACVRAQNLLAREDMISYGREGNRVLGNYASSLLYSYSPQESSYRYNQGRRFYISVAYQF